MKAVTVVVPGSLATRTGGSIYDRRVAEGLRARGWTVSIIELDSVVHPLAPPLHSAPAQFGDDSRRQRGPGRRTGFRHDAGNRRARILAPAIRPDHSHGSVGDSGADAGEAAWLSNLERRALARARHIVVTGARTKTIVSVMIERYDDQVTRIPPGVDHVRTDEARAPEAAPLRLLCVANLTWGKGHDILLRSLADATDGDWTLTASEAPSGIRVRRADPQDGLGTRARTADHVGRGVVEPVETSSNTRTSSCCRPEARPTAWPSPKPSPTACQSSARGPERSCRLSERAGSSPRPATPTRSPPCCARLQEARPSEVAWRRGPHRGGTPPDMERCRGGDGARAEHGDPT